MKKATLQILALAVGISQSAITEDRFGGIGVTIQSDRGGVRVVQVLNDSPAEAAGLHAGDLLVTVNGVNLTGDIEAAKTALRGSTGDAVTVTAVRPGEESSLTVTLERNGFILKSFGSADLASYYGDPTGRDYSATEVRYFANQSVEEGYQITDLMQEGRILESDQVQSSAGIQTVFQGSTSKSIQKLPISAGLAFRGLSRDKASFLVAQPGTTQIVVRDANGKQVLAVTAQDLTAGEHSVAWNGSTLGAGSYLVELRQGALLTSSPMTLE